jgi:hypothetical protein
MMSELTDRFCAHCGIPLAATVSGAPPGRPDHHSGGAAPAVNRDKITRFLCAAAHLDPAFAHSAIAEYLIEGTRAIPNSDGVDSAAVLRDCVAARRRRKIRDAILLFIIVVFAVVDPYAAVIWLFVAWLVAAAVNARRRGPILFALGVALLLGAAAIYFLRVGALVEFGITWTGPTDGDLIAGAFFVLVAYGVVALDELVVEQLTRERFRDSFFQPDVTQLAPGWERTVRTLGLADFAKSIERVAAADGDSRRPAAAADVLVHRMTIPFVGSGALKADQTLSLPLIPSNAGSDPPRRFTAAELTEHVAAAILGLRRSTSLSPSGRLADLSVAERVFVPATRLSNGLAGTPAAPVLAAPELPPARWMPIALARALVDSPLESARYYQCFRIESWESDIVTSCHFSTTTDGKTLYLEWTHSVLYPVKHEYRNIDHPTTAHYALRAVTIALTLPRYTWQRLKNVFQWFRHIPYRPGEIVPERYGSGTSLRELAADNGWHNYFQEADIVRYIRLVEQAIFRGVGDFLAERGYSVVDVLDIARTKISNTITISGGTFSGTAIGIGTTSQNSGQTQNSSRNEAKSES